MLPGEPNKRQLLDEMIRVNHAGELGAQQIYKGQIAVLRQDECASMLEHMAQQEQEHLEAFEQEMRERQVRPTALMPFWRVAGYALGAGTALMGKRAAMACTVAVESVIAEHYQEQIDRLSELEKEGAGEADLCAKITKFREEELEHHDIGIEQEAEQAPAYELLSGAIKAGCRLAIWTAKRV